MQTRLSPIEGNGSNQLDSRNYSRMPEWIIYHASQPGGLDHDSKLDFEPFWRGASKIEEGGFRKHINSHCTIIGLNNTFICNNGNYQTPREYSPARSFLSNGTQILARWQSVQCPPCTFLRLAVTLFVTI
jgi:hypothetical protein